MKEILRNARQAITVTIVLLVICGLAYPLALTGVFQVIFPKQANGSLITVEGKAVGAETIGQEFTEDYFLWGRPSAYHYNTYEEDAEGNRYYSDGTEYTGVSSGSNNYAPSNSVLTERVAADMENFLAKNPGVSAEDIPADLMTASGSGLDPHISPESAQIQVPRIAAASGLSEDEVQRIVDAHTEGKTFGIFGEETVNVLLVNIDIAEEMGILPKE